MEGFAFPSGDTPVRVQSDQRLPVGRVSTRWEFESIEHALGTFGSAGPSVAQREHMPPETLSELMAGAQELTERHNKATDGRVVLEPEYLQVVARKRG